MNLQKLLYRPYFGLCLPILLLLPFFLCLFYFSEQMSRLDILEERFALLDQKEKLTSSRREKEKAYFAGLEQADRFYIDKHLETLEFLEPERKKLSLRAQEDDEARQRLSYLANGSNRLLFAEENLKRSTLFEEVEERQQHPIEINEDDLKKLLTLIEGKRLADVSCLEERPQLIIKNLELSKKKVSPQEEVFVVDLQLIKRELFKRG